MGPDTYDFLKFLTDFQKGLDVVNQTIKTADQAAQFINSFSGTKEQNEYEYVLNAYKKGKFKEKKVEDLKPGDWIMHDEKLVQLTGYPQPVYSITEKIRGKLVKDAGFFNIESSTPGGSVSLPVRKIRADTILQFQSDYLSFGFGILFNKDIGQISFNDEMKKKYSEILEKYMTKYFKGDMEISDVFIGGTLDTDKIARMNDLDNMIENIKKLADEAKNIVCENAMKIFERLIKKFDFSVVNDKVVLKDVIKEKLYLFFNLEGFFGFEREHDNLLSEQAKKQCLELLGKYLPVQYTKDKGDTEYNIFVCIPFLKIKNDKDIDVLFKNLDKIEKEGKLIKL